MHIYMNTHTHIWINAWLNEWINCPLQVSCGRSQVNWCWLGTLSSEQVALTWMLLPVHTRLIISVSLLWWNSGKVLLIEQIEKHWRSYMVIKWVLWTEVHRALEKWIRGPDGFLDLPKKASEKAIASDNWGFPTASQATESIVQAVRKRNLK